MFGSSLSAQTDGAGQERPGWVGVMPGASEDLGPSVAAFMVAQGHVCARPLPSPNTTGGLLPSACFGKLLAPDLKEHN